jgi:hypothetical protein
MQRLLWVVSGSHPQVLALLLTSVKMYRSFSR